MKQLLRILIDEEGVTAVEYAVLLSFIALVLLSSVALLGQQSNGIWTSVQTNLTTSGALK